jgi:hypothetical protein
MNKSAAGFRWQSELVLRVRRSTLCAPFLGIALKGRRCMQAAVLPGLKAGIPPTAPPTALDPNDGDVNRYICWTTTAVLLFAACFWNSSWPFVCTYPSFLSFRRCQHSRLTDASGVEFLDITLNPSILRTSSLQLQWGALKVELWREIMCCARLGSTLEAYLPYHSSDTHALVSRSCCRGYDLLN